MLKRILFINLLLLNLALSSCVSKKNQIFFDFNNGEPIVKIKVKNYNDILDLTIPFREGYTHDKWYVDSKLEETLTENHNLKDISVLYLKWNKNNLYDKNSFLDIYSKALNNHKYSKDYEVSSKGYAKAALANQEIFSMKKIKDDSLYLYNASYGVAKTFVLLEKNNGLYNIKTGEPDKEFNISRVTKDENTTLENYLDKYGVSPYNLNYDINENTLLEIIDFKNADNKFYYKIKLRDESTTEYKKYILGINNLQSTNVRFENIVISFLITEDYFFEKIIYDEKYLIDIKITLVWLKDQVIENNIIEEYKYNKESEI